jgi:NitT/TauT family transport system substrate-binding protein
MRWYRNLSQIRNTPADSPAANETITIGYTTIVTHMWSPVIVKEFGLFEDELKRSRPKDRIEVKWHKAKDGMELVKEMLAGHIQFATLGDYALSVSHLLSGLLPDFRPLLLAAGGKSTDGNGFGMVVPCDLSLRSIAELATIPIATTFRTNAEYRLRKMLESHHLPELNLIHRSVEESIESLRQGRLSASIMWEPYLSLVQDQQIGKSVFNQELGLGYMAGVAADESWTLANEDLTVAYLKAHLLANRLIREQPHRAAKVLAKETGFASDVVTRSISKIRWDAALYKSDLNMINHFDPAKYFGIAASPNTQSEIKYNTKYLRIAAQELKLPVPPLALIEGHWQREIFY